jgi:hypothetical protein
MYVQLSKHKSKWSSSMRKKVVSKVKIDGTKLEFLIFQKHQI